MCLWHLKSKMMSRWRFVRHADAFGGDITENPEEDQRQQVKNNLTS